MGETARPWEGNYWATLAVAVVALIPFILITTATVPLDPQVRRALHATSTALHVVSGLAIAGYAFGALLGGDITQRFPQRRLFLLFTGLFIVGSGLAAAAPGAGIYGTGRILQGFATGLLLVAALPPVIRQFPPARMPVTAAAVNIGFFGAVTAGPLIGGAVAAAHAWRWMFAGFGAVAAVVLWAAVRTLPTRPAFQPGRKFDLLGMGLALAATALPFYAAAQLTSHPFSSSRFWAPLVAGLASMLALILVEYHLPDPVAPVKRMWHSFPITGTLVAMMAGAAFVAFLELAQAYLLQVRRLPAQTAGLALWPDVAGLLVISVFLGLLITRRYLPLLILGGLIALLGAGVVLRHLSDPHAVARISAASALLGLGAGATVGPGLWIAGFSLPAKMVGRILALVELVRSETDFILAPVLMRVARDGSHGAALTAAGVERGIVWTLAILAGASVFIVILHLASRGGLPRPDLAAWLQRDQPALPALPLRTGGEPP